MCSKWESVFFLCMIYSKLKMSGYFLPGIFFRILIRLKDEETIYTIVCAMFYNVHT